MEVSALIRGQKISDLHAALGTMLETCPQFDGHTVNPELLSKYEITLSNAKALLSHLDEALGSHSPNKWFAVTRTRREEMRGHLEKLQNIRLDINEILSMFTV